MRALFWKVLRFFLFRVDAESAHHALIRSIQLLLSLGASGRGALRILSGASPRPRSSSRSGPTVWGMSFASRVGLAAGFDKDGEILPALPCLGFGFAEIGTVTPRPQPGNARPRLFRDPHRRVIFNRMGFNGLGASLVAERLRETRAKLPEGFRVGVNVGKNKDTPLEDAARDYVKAARAFEGLCDYLVVNVSSPNTPGLRSLQSPEALERIVGEVARLISGWAVTPPLLLKLAPELFMGETDPGPLVDSAERWGGKGWVLTNTLAGSWQVGSAAEGAKRVEGGLSGFPLTSLSLQAMRVVRARSKLPIISVGGILSAEDAAKRIEAGAELVQVYSGWVFGGPGFPAEISRKTP